MSLTVGSLFSGIGGFDLGLERAGMRVIWQSEIDPYASAVLKKHWPGIPNHGDIRTIHAGNVERPDVLCGGFPCQDISNAGKRAGIDGERSGLWSEYARLVRELRPSFVAVENVTALLERGMGRVLGDLAALGYGAEWHCIPASAVGAPHDRDRVWIVAYPDQDGSIPCLQFTDWIQAQRQSCFWQSFRATDFSLRVQELAAICGDADGLPEELGAYGNAIVPQVAEVIGRAIVSAA